MNKLSQNSEDKLSTCDPAIQKVIRLAISRSEIDFGVSHGHRTPQEQNELYKKGRNGVPGPIVTYKDGYTRKSKHNELPSLAVDIFCAPKAIMYDQKHLTYVAGVIMCCAKELGVKLEWGHNWNGNGLLVDSDPNERFSDMPHFQL